MSKKGFKNSNREVFRYNYGTVRPQFEKIVNMIESNETLFVTKLDRFARNTREALSLVDNLLKEKVMIKILNLRMIDNTQMSRTLVKGLLLVAKMG